MEGKPFTRRRVPPCVSSDRVVLLDRNGKKRLVVLDGEMVNVRGLGVLRADSLRTSLGLRFTVGGRSFLVLSVSAQDRVETLRRGAQIVGAKDAASLVWNCDVKSGDSVVEVGTGSGALTVALANAVGPTGHVTSYDNRAEALETARWNLDAAGFMERVSLKLRDGRTEIAERDADALVLDIPDPWSAIELAWEALRPCGHLGTFSPNMEQVKETAAAIRKKPFVQVRTIELIEREMEVRELGVRPSFAPLGHTGYLTFARKVLDTF